MCLADGRLMPATEVDHIERHGNDPRRFYDPANLQGLCADHHRSYKAKQERSGNTAGCDASGNPLEPQQHWQR